MRSPVKRVSPAKPVKRVPMEHIVQEILNRMEPEMYERFCRDAKQAGLSPLHFGLYVMGQIARNPGLLEFVEESAIPRTSQTYH